jgi:hypothetical protein
MKLSARTIQILKNFCQINPSLVFNPGNTIATISPMATIMARANIEETIPQKFAIYELSRFLGVLSLFDDPDLEFTEKHVVITSGKQRLKYTYADPDHIKAPPDKNIPTPADHVEKILSSATLQSLMKAAAVLQLPDVAFTGRDGSLYVEALDLTTKSKATGATSDNYAIVIGDTTKQFRMVVKPENIKLLNDDYTMKISSNLVLNLKGPDVEYWISCEETSTYNG